MTLSPEVLAEGQRRIPYFFTHGSSNNVVCSDCARDVPNPEQLVAIYTASRIYMCGSCHAYIGPSNDEESSAA